MHGTRELVRHALLPSYYSIVLLKPVVFRCVLRDFVPAPT